jgi:parvulin-like peptidyl-prolyl isomerase
MAIPIKDIVIQELSPELVEPIQKLSIGEVSSPIELGEKYALVKLINRQPAKPLPLKSVGKSIKQEIYKEEYSGLRQAYVEKILEQSQIELNKRVWKNLYREMTSGN